MSAGIVWGAIGAIAAILALVYAIWQGNTKFRVLFVGALVGLFFGVLVVCITIGVNVIRLAMLALSREHSFVMYKRDVVFLYAGATTIGGGIGGVTGAMFSIALENKWAGILGGIIGGIIGLLIVEIALRV